ncbi:hypothetical protein ymoll0001_3940 [Yersinia mollaretii ATCC 43969]|uniref:Uncharacterized protein n=1 Tax=Yersinia mollaretii (strain ATCC 43969 / DSM 18520 / CIP 103324 / CNY 7263 / WAIP 204) TaxID=349967 RepID=A0ABP2EH46_YERMW|nr:hypothetical protein ymoll0001_3940 [Yersinia mollaretii ATCC 43969]
MAFLMGATSYRFKGDDKKNFIFFSPESGLFYPLSRPYPKKTVKLTL